uniref:Candidate secreted effector n=1 Tax=Meloidogyne incognita TaxID=6306 RepID=A0A914L4F9_MELIC
MKKTNFKLNKCLIIIATFIIPFFILILFIIVINLIRSINTKILIVHTFSSSFVPHHIFRVTLIIVLLHILFSSLFLCSSICLSCIHLLSSVHIVFFIRLCRASFIFMIIIFH